MSLALYLSIKGDSDCLSSWISLWEEGHKEGPGLYENSILSLSLAQVLWFFVYLVDWHSLVPLLHLSCPLFHKLSNWILTQSQCTYQKLFRSCSCQIIAYYLPNLPCSLPLFLNLLELCLKEFSTDRDMWNVASLHAWKLTQEKSFESFVFKVFFQTHHGRCCLKLRHNRNHYCCFWMNLRKVTSLRMGMKIQWKC